MSATTLRTPDLADLLDMTGLPWREGRWVGYVTELPNGNRIAVTEDDGTFEVTALTNGIHTSAKLSGIAAQALVLATIDALIGELA